MHGEWPTGACSHARVRSHARMFGSFPCACDCASRKGWAEARTGHAVSLAGTCIQGAAINWADTGANIARKIQTEEPVSGTLHPLFE